MALFECNSGGGLDYTLLWTNPKPDINLNTQTISLDLSNYSHIWVVAKQSTLSGHDYKPRSNCIVRVNQVHGDPQYIPSSSANDGISILGGTSNNLTFSNFAMRGVRANLDGVYFSNGVPGMNSSTSGSGSYAIPLYIFGIKSLGDLADYLEGTE